MPETRATNQATIFANFRAEILTGNVYEQASEYWEVESLSTFYV
jgi:hypothetical protein